MGAGVANSIGPALWAWHLLLFQSLSVSCSATGAGLTDSASPAPGVRHFVLFLGFLQVAVPQGLDCQVPLLFSVPDCSTCGSRLRLLFPVPDSCASGGSPTLELRIAKPCAWFRLLRARAHGYSVITACLCAEIEDCDAKRMFSSYSPKLRTMKSCAWLRQTYGVGLGPICTQNLAWPKAED